MTNAQRRENRYIRRRQQREDKRIAYNKQYDRYDNLLDPNALLKAFDKCKRGVSWKYSVQYYQMHLHYNINRTLEMLNNNQLPTKGFKYFQINERGKIRDISCPDIFERVFQKVLCDRVLIPILSRPLIYDNGASMKNKGTSFARKRIVKHLTEYRRKYGTEGYALIIDFSKYFNRINHDKLFQIIKRYIKDRRVLNICKQAVDEFGPVGLGLGSQISQILAVFFPNEMDHLIKEKLRVKYYGRYMDDSYLLSPDKDFLKDCLRQITALCNEYGIVINTKKTRIIKIKYGVPFLQCKYIFGEKGKVLKIGGKESAKRMKRKLRRFSVKLSERKMTAKEIRDLYQSWKGFMRQFDSRELLNNMDRYYNNLFMYTGE